MPRRVISGLYNIVGIKDVRVQTSAACVDDTIIAFDSSRRSGSNLQKLPSRQVQRLPLRQPIGQVAARQRPSAPDAIATYTSHIILPLT